MATKRLEETDVVILGAGLTGLTSARILGDHAVVLEQAERPGGIARTEHWNGYWFDHVLHLLYFENHDEVNRLVMELLGDDLATCPPESWVITSQGKTHFPFQYHLDGLDKEMVIACILDLAERTYGSPMDAPRNFQEMLEMQFGLAMCEVFQYPYNRKFWKRPLHELAPSGFTWNIARGDLEKVLRCVLPPKTRHTGYNAKGWYPRPSRDSSLRGMEVLSNRLAAGVSDLRLGHKVTSIDTESQIVTYEVEGRPGKLRYRDHCLSTIPMPAVLMFWRQAPTELLDRIDLLTWNRVVNVCFSIQGQRPKGTGHWQYYADEALVFNRLVFMHEFDPLSAPSQGWGFMAEIVLRAEDRMLDDQAIRQRAREDVQLTGVIPPGCEIIEEHVIVSDPAYVVFSLKNWSLLEQARDALLGNGITPLGRYGQWAYQSMAQCMNDGLVWAKREAKGLSVTSPKDNAL